MSAALLLCISVDHMKTLLNVKFSDRESSVYQSERNAYTHFVDFLDECAGIISITCMSIYTTSSMRLRCMNGYTFALVIVHAIHKRLHNSCCIVTSLSN